MSEILRVRGQKYRTPRIRRKWRHILGMCPHGETKRKRERKREKAYTCARNGSCRPSGIPSVQLQCCDSLCVRSHASREQEQEGWKRSWMEEAWSLGGKGRVGEVERKGGNVKRKETVDGGKERAKEKKEERRGGGRSRRGIARCAAHFN